MDPLLNDQVYLTQVTQKHRLLNLTTLDTVNPPREGGNFFPYSPGHTHKQINTEVRGLAKRENYFEVNLNSNSLGFLVCVNFSFVKSVANIFDVPHYFLGFMVSTYEQIVLLMLLQFTIIENGQIS